MAKYGIWRTYLGARFDESYDESFRQCCLDSLGIYACM